MAKVENLLHAANVVVSTVGVAVAGFTVPGAAAGIGGLLSAMPIARMVWPKSEPLEARVANALAEKLATTPHLPPEADKLIPQMIVTGALSPDEIMGAARDPEKICTAMLAKLDDPEHIAPPMQAAFRKVLAPVFRDLLADTEVSDTLRPSFENAVAQSLAHIQSVLEKLYVLSEKTALDLGVKTGLLMALARRYAVRDANDFDSALAGLEAALELAHADRLRLPSNADDAVNEITARVDALNDQGRLDEGWDALQRELDAHREEDARRAAAKTRLLDKGVAQAVLRADADGAAALLLERLDQDAPADPFKALRAEQDRWYVTGRDKGRAFDLEVSIALARASLARANGADQRGTALNGLGIALATLGDRETGTDRLDEAVTAFREALKVYTRDRVPLQWATTQMNLGNALLTLGERETGTDRLDEAITAFREALKEVTRDHVPLQWAMTQMNLGSALLTLGEREPGTARLDDAVAAYREALKERPRDRVPLQWATTQMNLGNALLTLGQRETGTDRLDDAVAAYREVLKVYTRDRVPLDWATTQMNLGNALTTLGDRETGTARLEEAVTAYRPALEEFPRDRVPLQWAMAQGNLAIAELALYRKTPDPALLARARERVVAARDVFTEGAPLYVEMADTLLAEIDAAAGD